MVPLLLPFNNFTCREQSLIKQQSEVLYLLLLFLVTEQQIILGAFEYLTPSKFNQLGKIK